MRSDETMAEIEVQSDLACRCPLSHDPTCAGRALVPLIRRPPSPRTAPLHLLHNCAAFAPPMFPPVKLVTR